MNTKIKSTLLVTTLLVLAACSKKSDTPTESEMLAQNIVGGAVATDSFQKENGVVALVITSEDGQGLCSGTLISKRIVLTAAHCLDGSGAAIESIAVVFTTDVEKAAQETVRFGVKGRIHEAFLTSAGGPGAWNDIALLKLNEDAPAGVNFAKLPSIVSAPLKARTMLVQAGFGRTEAARDSTTATSGVLKQVSGIEVLKLINDGKEMHLRENGKGSCNGDSGGPAFAKVNGKLTQVGINSRGTDPASCIGVGVFTTVGPHLAWIQKNSELLLAAETVPTPATPAPAAPVVPETPAAPTPPNAL